MGLERVTISLLLSFATFFVAGALEVPNLVSVTALGEGESAAIVAKWLEVDGRTRK